MNHDGTKSGFALDIIKKLADALPIPVIASGGGGTMQHFRDVFKISHADVALAASVFHFKKMKITELKQYLASKKIHVRI